MPDAADPLHWRSSAANHGNPGGGDALAPLANPSGDDDGDGISNLVEQAVGSGAMPVGGSETVLGQRHMTFTLERNPMADTDWTLESVATLGGTWAPAGVDFEITARTTLPGGIERVTLRSITPAVGNSGFLRGKLRAP